MEAFSFCSQYSIFTKINGLLSSERSDEIINESLFLGVRNLAMTLLKDTHREKAPSNETPVLTKSTNMGIWVLGTSNQLFMRYFYSETKFSKK